MKWLISSGRNTNFRAATGRNYSTGGVMGNHAQQGRRLVLALVAAFGAAVSGAGQAQAGRDYISVVGSSTVYPFAIVVAENFARRNPSFRAPKVEPLGTGGGIKA